MQRIGSFLNYRKATFPRVRRARKVTERPSPREFPVSGPIPTDFLLGLLALLTRVLSIFFSHLGALSWENSEIAGMGSISFKMPFPDPPHSVKAFPTLAKGLPLGLVESVSFSFKAPSLFPLT